MKCLVPFILWFPLYSMQQQKIQIPPLPSPTEIVINVNEQAAPATPPGTKIKVACIAATSSIICSIITAAITSSIYFTKCKG